MGTQSKETVDLAAAKARDALDTEGAVQHHRPTASLPGHDYSDQLADYTQNEPIKAMLIAAAAGALLMGLISLLGAL